MSSQQHPHVTFSVRYRESFLPTLNAITALQRADELADEVDELISLEKIADNDPNSERRPKRLELISYVAVGLVTCLEWHARSRFIDLLAHYPEEISESDAKRIDKAALSQLTASKLTVPHLLGAAVKINSVEDYTEIMDRLYKKRNSKNSANRLLSLVVPDPRPFHNPAHQETIPALRDLFSFAMNWFMRSGLVWLAIGTYGQLGRWRKPHGLRTSSEPQCALWSLRSLP